MRKLYVNFIKMRTWTFKRVWGSPRVTRFGEDLSRHYLRNIFLRREFKLMDFFVKELVFFKLNFKSISVKSDLNYKLWFDPIFLSTLPLSQFFCHLSVEIEPTCDYPLINQNALRNGFYLDANKFFYLNEFWFSASMPFLSISNYEFNAGIELKSYFDSDWFDGLLNTESVLWNNTLSSLLSLGSILSWQGF